jgi:hypothetical protein
MHYSEVKLPKDKQKLIGCYLYLSNHLRALWVEYVTYAEESLGPTDAEVFKILFAEMDFFEGLRQRVADQLPVGALTNMRRIDDYSRW